MTYEDVTINQYINAKWKGDTTHLSFEELSEIESEYIDTAGLFESEEFHKVAYIHYLNNRKNSISLSIRLQEEFIKEFNIPYIPELKFFKKFGHIVKWNEGDIEGFIEQLRKVEYKEKKYISQLETSIKELTDLRKKRNSGEKPKEQTRGKFISTLISLGKIGYDINRNETTMEELAYMIKNQSDEAARINKQTNKK